MVPLSVSSFTNRSANRAAVPMGSEERLIVITVSPATTELVVPAAICGASCSDQLNDESRPAPIGNASGFPSESNTAISKDDWARYFAELYLFVAFVFLVLTSVLSALERRFVGSAQRG